MRAYVPWFRARGRLVKVIERREPVETSRQIRCHECRSTLEVVRSDVKGLYPSDRPNMNAEYLFQCPVCNRAVNTSAALFIVPQEPLPELPE